MRIIMCTETTEFVMEGGEKSYCKQRFSKHEHNGNTTDGSYWYSGIYLFQRCGNFCVPHPLVNNANIFFPISFTVFHLVFISSL